MVQSYIIQVLRSHSEAFPASSLDDLLLDISCAVDHGVSSIPSILHFISNQNPEVGRSGIEALPSRYSR